MDSTQNNSLPPTPSIQINLDQLENLSEEEQAYMEEPALALIGKDVMQMTHDELQLHIASLRSMRTGADGVKTLLRLDATAIREKKPRAKRVKKDVDISALW